jgi:putative spermidine/putrescine transport system ATP-binding protein
VAFGLRSKGVDRASALGRAREALERVNLRGFGARRVETLSGGEAQRVALARALAPEPSVLLLDEPLASLDRELREDLRREIRRVHRELGLTTAYVTHDRDEALTLGDRVVILQAGSIVESGRPEELLSNPKTAFGARFLGAWNALPAERDGAYVRSVLGLGQPVTAAAKGAKGPGHLLIAKEAIVIESAEAGAAAGLPCRLVEFAPHLRMATVEVGGVLVTGRADFSERRAVGELVRISVDPKEGRFVSTDGVGEGK